MNPHTASLDAHVALTVKEKLARLQEKKRERERRLVTGAMERQRETDEGA